MTEPTRQRSLRSDAGHPRFTQRDLEVFRFLADMKAMYDTDLRVFLGRRAGRPLGEEAVRSLLRRWQRAGVAEARKIIYDRPRIVRLLSGGAQLVDEESFQPTSEFMTYHQADVARCRLWIEGTESPSHGRMADWRSERRIRQNIAHTYKGRGRSIHVPDGVITWADGAKAAVEIERSPKDVRRLRRIMSDLAEGSPYAQVVYFVANDSIERSVSNAYNEIAARAQKEGRTQVAKLSVVDIPESLEV